ncbi:MAG: iron ABC transporter permease [Chloroflexi bacterium]|nr:iron ABC transporter permease [Chloroflexota bacterium]
MTLWAPLGFLALFFLYPLAAILGESFQRAGGTPFAPFFDLLADPYYLDRIGFTFWQATLSTILTLAVGLPSAYAFARHNFLAKTLLRSLITVPFVMPPIVMALGFVALLGPQGALNALLVGLFSLEEPPFHMMNTLAIILLAHVVYEYAIVVRLVSTFWSNLDPRLEASARVLGAGPWTAFYRVTLPLLMPAIGAAAALVFLFTFTSFGVVLILGGSSYATIDVSIYTLAMKLFRLPLAAALAIVQIALTFLVMLVYARLQEATATRIELAPQAATPPGLPRRRGYLLLGGVSLAVFIVVSPLLALVVRSLFPATGEAGLSLAGFSAISSNERNAFFFVSPLMAIRNSLTFALLTTLISLPLGTAAAYILARSRGWWRSPVDALLMLPLGTSSVTLGLGFLLGFDQPPFDLRATWVIIVLAHSLVAYPFVLRSVLSTLRAMDPSLREAARTLGATPLAVFRLVELPLIWRGLLVGATFAFAVSIGEFGASLILVRPEYTTMPLAIFRYLGQPGGQNLTEALAMTTLLMVVTAAGFLIIERLRPRGTAEF